MQNIWGTIWSALTVVCTTWCLLSNNNFVYLCIFIYMYIVPLHCNFQFEFDTWHNIDRFSKCSFEWNKIFFYKLLLKPLMFLCPLFCEFCETNKTMKLKGVNSNTIPTLISVGCWKSAVGSWLNDWFTCEQAGCE